MPQPPPNGVIRFGAFEVEPQAGILRKGDARIRLQEQPFQVLLALLEKPGAVVTREELHQKVWNGEEFGDLDHRLNMAVNKIREALRDSTENPRFVETLPKRGYRFIAPVESPQPAGPAPPTPASEPPPKKRPWWTWAAAASVVLLVGAGLGIWLALDRGSLPPPRVVRLTAFGGSEIQPTFSPDGEQVAFAWNGDKQDNYDIYVMMVGNSTALRLTSTPAADLAPSWSPDGRQIAFIRCSRSGGDFTSGSGGLTRGTGEIYLISPLGGTERRLLDLPVDTFSQPSWSQDGKFLAVARAYDEKSDDSDNGAVMLIPVESGGPPRRILAPQPGSCYQLPTFSSEGRRLAIYSCTVQGEHAGQVCQLQILTLNAELFPAGNPRATTASLTSRGGIAWTADGDSVVLAERKTTEFYLWRIPVTGKTEPQRLEAPGAGAIWPAIDARRHRLVFSRSLYTTSAWRWEREGKTAALLESALRISVGQFSHDGRRILYGRIRSGERANLWVANADWTGHTQITHGEREGDYRWSPDDRWIAYASMGQNGRWDIWVVEARGGPARALTHGPTTSAAPSWSRDGKWVYFFSSFSSPSGRTEIWRAPAQGGPSEQVTRRGGFAALESTDGKTLYYTKNESAAEGLFAMPLAGGEERQVFKDRVTRRCFAVFSDGIYYITSQGPNAEIRFHEFSSGRTQKVFTIDGFPAHGFSVSPDRKTFLFSTSNPGADLMMVENFR